MVLTEGFIGATRPGIHGFGESFRQFGEDSDCYRLIGMMVAASRVTRGRSVFEGNGPADKARVAGTIKADATAFANGPEARGGADAHGIVRLGHLLGAELSDRVRCLLEPLRLELRIDVNHPDESVEAELDALYRRLHTPGDALNSCGQLPALQTGLIFHHREADDEHYVYVEDTVRGRLAGYTVLNRLVEVDRRTDRHVRSPHSKYAAAYQCRGIASAVYGWPLSRGFCLVSGARQSEGAQALWRALARSHPLRWVVLWGKRMYDLGPEASPDRAAELDTRILLLGQGWSLAELHGRGMLHSVAEAAGDTSAT